MWKQLPDSLEAKHRTVLEAAWWNGDWETSPCNTKHALGWGKQMEMLWCPLCCGPHLFVPKALLWALTLTPVLAPGSCTGMFLLVQGPTEFGKANTYDSTCILNWKIPPMMTLQGGCQWERKSHMRELASYTILSFYASKTGQMSWWRRKPSASNHSQSPWLLLHKGPGLHSSWKGNRAWIAARLSPRTQDVCNLWEGPETLHVNI